MRVSGENIPLKETVMRKSRFTIEAMIAIINEHEAGAKAADLCRRPGLAEATLYRWTEEFGGLEISDANGSRSM